MNKQYEIFDYIKDTSKHIDLISEIQTDEITNQISKMFDYDFNGTIKEKIDVPTFPKNFEIGLIVGSSGSGKSTLLHKEFGYEEDIYWDNSKSIASNFDSYEEATEKFGATGLNSVPTWLKPYRVLSNGEKFRADLSRRLKSNSVIDEFTSVVNRECAISCSMSISKYIRKKKLENIVFCSCHDDIIPYLNPSWIYNTDTHTFYNGRYLRRKEINIEINYCSKGAWDMFKKYHYLSGDLNNSSNCYVASFNDIPIGFVAILALPGGSIKHAFREHRVVILPDYQGMGIGNKLSETIGQAYIEKGCRYFAKTSNPRMGVHRDNSGLWRATAHNHKKREEYIDKNGNIRKNGYTMSEEKLLFHSQRVCYCHEYIGNGLKYPFTYGEINKKDSETQMTIFDFL